jgi:Polyketide cyclase / dehydrase and lipid transport
MGHMSTSTRWWLNGDSQETIVHADPVRIYGLVSDLPRMGEWSPECQKVEWGQGVALAAAGSTFIGHNVGGPMGLMKWSRRGRVLVADEGREFAFVTEEGGRESTEWRYRLAPTEEGTKVTESYEVHWIPSWARLLDIPTNRARELRANMASTLERLKVAAERSPGT